MSTDNFLFESVRPGGYINADTRTCLNWLQLSIHPLYCASTGSPAFADKPRDTARR